ncbi:MAG: tetratricopeptide repeat protein, partial [Gammaproteobacteria bacterium]|nr:tetratricopeptide repeat protein [Gammaproteobacteria bacterium]
RIGDIELAEGNTDEATKLYKVALAIHEKLIKTDPEVVLWQTSLVVDYYKLSRSVQSDKKQYLTDALKILKQLDSENHLPAEQQGWIPIIESELE